MKPEIVAQAQHRLEELVSFFGVNAQTTVTVDEGEQRVELDIASDTTGRLIGHHGETLRAIEYLLNMMMKEAAPNVRFGVDVAGYRQARAEQLADYARKVAAQVAQTGEEVTLRPLNPAERRIVHMTLADSPEVQTASHGEPPRRTLVIKKR